MERRRLQSVPYEMQSLFLMLKILFRWFVLSVSWQWLCGRGVSIMLWSNVVKYIMKSV